MMPPIASPKALFDVSEPARCLLLVLSVWCVVLVGRIVQEATGAALSVAVSFAVATWLVASVGAARSLVLQPIPLSLAFFSGFASYPSWLALVWLLGSSLGLPAAESGAASTAWPLWIATLLLAPVFEELLYREHVQSLVQKHHGNVAAVLASSVLFAVAHFEAWSVLNAFLTGLALGAVRLVTGSVALCVALHAGFNLATLACGLPPERLALSPAWSAALGWVALLAAVGMSGLCGRSMRVPGARDA